MRAVLGLAVVLAAAAALAEREAATTRRAILDATVGPGFTITFRNATGGRVRRLKPGVYAIVVNDRSPIHNFHLLGPGVNKATSVVATGRIRWTVRLARAIYRFRCDPHRTIMHGSFAVG